MSDIKDLLSNDVHKIAETMHQLAQEIEDGCAGILSLQLQASWDKLPKLTLIIQGSGKHEDDLLPYRAKR